MSSAAPLPPAAAAAAAPAPLPWLAALLGTLALVAAGALWLSAHPTGAVWAGLTPADCAEYCEGHTRCGPLETRPAVQQPLNSWSNAAFAFVGLLALRTRPRSLALLFAGSAVLLGIGSFWFHASVTREGQWLDMVGTYASVVAVAALGLERLGVRARTALALALGLDVLLAVFKWQLSGHVVLPLLVVAASVPIALAVRAGRGSARAALAPLALLVVAVLLREADVRRVLCWPESALFQGHAVWHLLCAASLGAAWQFLAGLPAAGPQGPAARRGTREASALDFDRARADGGAARRREEGGAPR